jgi:hypothetical protein
MWAVSESCLRPQRRVASVCGVRRLRIRRIIPASDGGFLRGFGLSVDAKKMRDTALGYGRLIAAVVLLGAGTSLLVGVGGPWGWVLAIVAVGAMAAAVGEGMVSAAVMGGVAGVLGSGYAVLIYRAPRAVKALKSWHAGYPQSQVHDQFLGPLIKSSAVNEHWWGRADVGLVVAVAAGIVVVAIGARWLAARAPAEKDARARAVLGSIAVAAVATALVLGAWTSQFRTASTHELARGSYRYDSAIYMNAYFNLLHGMPYYEGFVKAAAGDSRLIADKSVRNGKFYGWAYSASFIRMPWTFYIWRLLAPTGGLWYVSLLVCVLALFAVWWGMYPVLSARASMIPAVLFPLLMTCTAWVNMYFPDWWAGLAILLSVMFQIRKRYVLAGAFALLAGIFRDVALVWLVILLVNALVMSWRAGAEWRRRAALYAAFLAGFFVLYFIHLRAGAPFVVPQPGALSIAGRLSVSFANSLSQRFFAPAIYMMVAYGWLMGHHALMMLLQVPGWALVLRRERPALLPVLAFVGFWIAFTATIGATSSYWGQMYTPIAMVGSAALFAWAAPKSGTVSAGIAPHAETASPAETVSPADTASPADTVSSADTASPADTV